MLWLTVRVRSQPPLSVVRLYADAKRSRRPPSSKCPRTIWRPRRPPTHESRLQRLYKAYLVAKNMNPEELSFEQYKEMVELQANLHGRRKDLR